MDHAGRGDKLPTFPVNICRQGDKLPTYLVSFTGKGR